MAKLKERGRKAPPQARRKALAPRKAVAPEKTRGGMDLKRQLAESRARQAATAAILKVIARSPSDAQPVFGAIVDNARRLVGAVFSVLYGFDGKLLSVLADRQSSAKASAALRGMYPAPAQHGHLVGRAVLDGQETHTTDIRVDARFRANRNVHAKVSGFRAALVVPLKRAGKVIGAVAAGRLDPRPFSSSEIQLLRAFADQAVIAIENVRMFNETREALERQTATAEILRVISSSPGDVHPVFDAIIENAMHLCDAHLGTVGIYDGTNYQHVAQRGGSAEYGKWLFSGPFVSDPAHTIGKMVAERRPVHVPDYRELPEYRERNPRAVATAELGGARTFLAVPMLKDGSVVGGITIRRTEVRPFTQRQIDLVSTFASQAVIAIENVRLFNETKEALERQTATAEILRVISSSPGDVQPMLDAVAERAVKLCESGEAGIFLVEGERIRFAAGCQTGETFKAGETLPLNRSGVIGRAVIDLAPVHVVDLAAVPVEDFPLGREYQKRFGHRSIVAVPLMRENHAIGAIALWRFEVRAFSDKHIALVRTFADQATIAIENVRLFNETKESLERQTATAEILNVIARSPSDVQPVFDAIAESARRLIGGLYSVVTRKVADSLHLAASTRTTPEGDAALKTLFPTPITGQGAMGKAVMTRSPVAVEDIEADPIYSATFRAGARARGMRSMLCVPMLREGEAIGVLSVNRAQPGPFSDHQTNLLKTFADQAVIAIENVRLFNETQEALARQAAAAQVLRAISESVSDTAPVFTAILDCCNRLIPNVDYVQVQLIEGSDRVRLVDHRFGQVRGAAPGKQDERRAELMAREAAHFPRPLANSTLERALNQGRVVILADTLDGPDTPPGTLVDARRWGHSYSQITVPLMREGRCIGAIEAFRRPLGGFEAKESSLLESFADQAVIAIENVRLFNETKEALEQQTATAEILKVIASSPSDVQPVFDAIVQSAGRLFAPCDTGINMLEGNLIYLRAGGGPTVTQARFQKLVESVYPLPFDASQNTVSQTILEGRIVEVSDSEGPDVRPATRAAGRAANYRSFTYVPLVREGVGIGALTLTHPEPGFKLNDKQRALLQTFADQAVIAIENVRLFKELQSRTEALTKSVGQLTALGEVGQAISSTLDLETVLQTIVSRAVQLTGLDGGSVYEYDERSEEFRLQAADNQEPELLEAIRRTPIRKGDGTVGGTAVTLEAAQVPDILDAGYQSSRKELLIRAGYRAILTVPLLREGRVIGALSVTRKTPGPFAPEIVALLKTFATQSAMAIQNARLFREIAEKGRQLEVASRHKSDFLSSMSHELRTPLNAILGFNEMILGQVYGEVPADMQEPLNDIQTSGKHLLRLINNVLDLAKIEAGRMELSLSDYSVHDTVASVHSTLRPLAAEKGLEFLAAVPSDVPLAYGDGGRMAQCLMNLAGNSLKFTKAGKVEIAVETKGELLVYRVTDTGIGIAPDKIGSLFTEFKQTDATIASEYGGTGLGLSISRKFVEMHGGRIWVESELGEGSAFIIEVPLRVTTT